MGNLDFLEKKPRIAYTLSWDGVTEGKDKATSSLFSLYNFSNEEYSLQGLINANAGLEKSIDEFINAASVSYTFDINTNFDIILTNSEFKEYSVPRATLWKYAENATTEKDYIGKQIGLIFIDFMVNKEYSLFLAYSFVEGSSCTDGYYGPAFGPTFNKVGWYIGAVSMKNIPVGEIGYIKNSMPLVSINYSGKGFTSPKEYYSKLSNSIEADDYYTIWIDHTVIEAASGKEDDYNAICNPGDWNSKADIQLDEKLAKLLKAMSYNKVSAIVKYTEAVSKKTPENLGQIKTQQYITAWTVNKNQLNIYYGDDIIFRQTYDVEEHAKWYAKYFSNTP